MITRMFKELKEDVQKQLNSKRIWIKTQEDTNTTKWTLRQFQQTLEWNQENYLKRYKWNKEGSIRSERVG
jgi:hypothetical protein